MSNVIPPDTLLIDLRPSRFLKAIDLRERWHVDEITVTIAEFRTEEIEPRPGQKERAPVLYFRTKAGAVYPQGFLLTARVNIEALAASTGAHTIGEAVGKRIRIIIAQHKGKDVLRISPEKVAE